MAKRKPARAGVDRGMQVGQATVRRFRTLGPVDRNGVVGQRRASLREADRVGCRKPEGQGAAGSGSVDPARIPLVANQGPVAIALRRLGPPAGCEDQGPAVAGELTALEDCGGRQVDRSVGTDQSSGRCVGNAPIVGGPQGSVDRPNALDRIDGVGVERDLALAERENQDRTLEEALAKCRKTLVVDEQIIDSAWSGRVKTIGTVQVRDGGSLSKAHVVVGDLILDGHIEDSNVKICRRLELGSHASGDIAKIDTRDILIRRDAKVSYRSKLRCENFIVEGNFRGTIEVSGLVTVMAGAFLQGQVKAARLRLHEGGGLKATVKIAGTSKQ